MTDQHGQTLALHALRRRTVVLTFLYTNCPDTCPLYLSKIAGAERLLGAATAQRPQVVVVTVDPDRDTVESLRRYAQLWPSDWHFLTGVSPQLAGVWDVYRIYVTKRPPQHSSEVSHGYSVVHNSKLLVVDGRGQIAAELTGDAWTAKTLAGVLRGVGHAPSWRALPAALQAPADLVRRCGQLAAANPGVFFGLAVLIMLPGLVLPVFLMRTFLR
ncbi:MAG: SCO family protein [Chloroflexota bacterium]|nr:SCO family protein [Chloroflexota bacterium]